MSSSSKSTKAIVTKEDQIGYIFGRALETLPNHGGFFSELEIVRHYIYHFDGIRGTSFHVKKGLRNNIVNTLIDSLISACQSQGFKTQQRTVIRDRVKKIIERADHLIVNGSACNFKSNEKFITETRLKFSKCCHIAIQEDTPFLTPESSNKKRKTESLVSLKSNGTVLYKGTSKNEV